MLQVCKTIDPFAAPKKISIVNDLPKTHSGKIMRRIMYKIVAGEGDQVGDPNAPRRHEAALWLVQRAFVLPRLIRADAHIGARPGDAAYREIAGR